MADPRNRNFMIKNRGKTVPDPRTVGFFKNIQEYIEDIGSYASGSKRESESDSCFSGKESKSKIIKTELLNQQKLLVSVILQEKIRGLLVFHGLGSGKTCASIASALSLYNKGLITNVIVLLPKSIRPNFMAEIETCKPDEQKLTGYKIFHYNSSNMIDTMLAEFECNDVDTLIDKLARSLFIVDESHRLVQMMHNALVAHEKMPGSKKQEFSQKSKGYKIYNILMRVNRAKILLLSGTPLTNYAYEAAVLGNVLTGYVDEGARKYTIFPEISDAFYRKYVDEDEHQIYDNRVGDFERRFIGKITYFPNVSDTQFPRIKQNVEIKCNMGDNQLHFYNDMLKLDKVKMAMGGSIRSSMTSTYRIYSRMSSNFVFPSSFYSKYLEIFIKKNNIAQKVFEYSDFMSHGQNMKEITQKNIKTYLYIIADFTEKFKQVANLYFYRDLASFSCKYAELKKKLQDTLESAEPKKTLIYSNFKNYAGLYTIELLLNSLGLQRVSVEDESGSSGAGPMSVNVGSAENVSVSVSGGIDDEMLPHLHEQADDEQMDEDERESEAKEYEYNEYNLGVNSDYDDEDDNDGETGRPGVAGGVRGKKPAGKQSGPYIFKYPELSEILDKKEKQLLDKINQEIKKMPKIGYLVYSGKNLNKVVSMFNAENNKLGEIIPILVITSAGSEGISLKQTRYVHIMEPYWNHNRTEQVIGRARRLCSHVELDEKYRDVSVFQYVSRINVEKSVDESILQIATEKKKIIDSIYNIFMDVSVDCAKLEGRPTCTQYKYDMSLYDPKIIKSKYLYDYFDSQGKQRYDDINRYTEQKYFKMYPLDSADGISKYYLGQTQDGKWKIIELVSDRYGTYYTVDGNINKIAQGSDFYIVSDKDKNPLYKLSVNALKHKRYVRAEITETEMRGLYSGNRLPGETSRDNGNGSPAYPHTNAGSESNQARNTNWTVMN